VAGGELIPLYIRFSENEIKPGGVREFSGSVATYEVDKNKKFSSLGNYRGEKFANKTSRCSGFSSPGIAKGEKFVSREALRYATSSKLGATWSFGFLLLAFLVIQIITGLFLACFYVPTGVEAFDSVHATIFRRVHYGWLAWYLHCNTASFLFIFLYGHLIRGVYYRAYYRKSMWLSGCVLFVAMMAAAFSGYVLPWGSMSFWAVTVITNFFTTIPVVGLGIAK